MAPLLHRAAIINEQQEDGSQLFFNKKFRQLNKIDIYTCRETSRLVTLCEVYCEVCDKSLNVVVSTAIQAEW